MCKSEIFAKIIALVSKGTEIPTELIVSDNRVTEIVTPTHEEKQENNPNEPTSLTAKTTVVTAVHSYKQIRVYALLLQKWCKHCHHAATTIVPTFREHISLCFAHNIYN